MANETAKHISPPPSNETLSHSNGKVVFDHEPKQMDTIFKSKDFHTSIE